eukprot:3759182-Prymnesium_polylepis.3
MDSRPDTRSGAERPDAWREAERPDAWSEAGQQLFLSVALGTGVVWCGLVWSGVIWCGLGWSGVVWGGAPNLCITFVKISEL